MFKANKLQAAMLLAGVVSLAGAVPAFAQINDTTTASLTITAGVLTITAPETVSLGSLSISDIAQTASGTTGAVTIQDLRGSNAGWTSTATMTNFVGQTITTELLPLADDVTGTNSYFTLTPGALGVSAGDAGLLAGLTDYTTAQDTSSLTLMTVDGVSNTFNIAAFSSGNGAGSFEKTLDLDYEVLPYLTYTTGTASAQTYSATLTSTVV